MSSMKSSKASRHGGIQIEEKLFFVVEGLFEKSDSIGYDCVRQFEQMLRLFPHAQQRIFSRQFDQSLYPRVKIEPVETLLAQIDKIPDATIIYHYCDGWELFENALDAFPGRLIIRWHNNTPPWFLSYRRNYVERTLRGFERILQLSQRANTEYWCNSDFSVEQLCTLGIPSRNCRTIYPCSRFLDVNIDASKDIRQVSTKSTDSFDIIFVSRIVPHKGHRHVIAVAHYLKLIIKTPVVVHFPGRLDVHEYSEDLRSLSAALGVDLRLYAEVDNDTLASLFRNANCLLFLSEHEGFGLPIYEAVRLQVPVVAWSITAVSETMGKHPLASYDLNYKDFAIRLGCLTDDSINSDVLAWQNTNIAPIYTVDRIGEQIIAAMSGSEAPRHKIVNPDRDLLRRINGYWSAVKWPDDELEIQSHIREIPKDIPGNFVTKHDIISYLTMLRDDLTALNGHTPLEENSDAFSGVRINAIRFSRRGGQATKEGLRFDLANIHAGHFIFGPFVQLPQGDFRVEFDISIERLPAVSGPLIFEAASANRVLSYFEAFAIDFEEVFVPIVEFSMPEMNGVVEFRLLSKGWSQGLVIFRGVNLYRLPTKRDIVEFSLTTALTIGGPVISPKHSLISRFFAKLNGSKPVADLSKADAARDGGDWEKAALFYSEYINAHGDDVEVLVQYGNCLKEARKFNEAERAYKRALKHAPRDADLHLQLGHLLKLRGRKVEAIAFYARALALSRPGRFAAEELVALGLDLNLQKRFL